MSLDLPEAPVEVVEDFRVRREIEHRPRDMKEQAISAELEREAVEGSPWGVMSENEAEDAIDRWLDPEPVPRALVTHAMWEMEKHWWVDDTCCCGVTPECTGEMADRARAMREHKEDRLASMLGLSIRPEPGGASG